MAPGAGWWWMGQGVPYNYKKRTIRQQENLRWLFSEGD